MPLDPFAQHSVQSLKALGPKAVVELMAIVDKRADHNQETFVEACRRLPEAWRATMLLAHVVASLERGEPMSDVLWSLEQRALRALVIEALGEIGERGMAKDLAAVDAAIDYDEDVEESGGSGDEGPQDPVTLARIRKKIGALVAGMDSPFPEEKK